MTEYLAAFLECLKEQQRAGAEFSFIVDRSILYGDIKSLSQPNSGASGDLQPRVNLTAYLEIGENQLDLCTNAHYKNIAS